MPIYPTIKTYRGGFYHNIRKNGKDDKVYSAIDMRKPYDTVFSDGIMPEADGTAGNSLKVTAAGGMNIAISKGNAKLGGAWFENTGSYVITLDTANGAERYDCIIIRNDDNDDVRDPSIYVKSLNRVPTVADLSRPENGGDEKIYEVCIAYVRVPAIADTIDDSNITDTREDGSLCNTMSGVGATVVRSYSNTVFSERNGQTGVTIGIPQYNKARDTLIVAVEGRVFTEGTHYTIPSNTYIELAIGLPVIGTRIDFQVLKNVNAAGAETVVQEVAALRAEATAMSKTLEHHYYCTGVNDNVAIGRIISDFQAASGNFGSMRLVVHGAFKATAPAGGQGTADNLYYWIRSAQGAASDRKVTIDFTDCSEIAINCSEGTHNIVFFGMDSIIIGANVRATGGETINMFSPAGATSIHAENCRFWITTQSNGLISRSGTFRNCRASVTNTTGHSYCFAPVSASLLRLFGGEYYSYVASTDHFSAIVGLTSGADAVAILYGVNAPTVARSGYRQTHSAYQTTGWLCSTDLISNLPIKEVSGLANIRGTLSLSKAGLM